MRAIELFSIPIIVRRPDGYHIRVVSSDGAEKQARWVGPFRDARGISRWIAMVYEEQRISRDMTEYFHPAMIGLPPELAVLRSLEDQVETLRRAGLLDGEEQVSVVE